MAVVVQHNCFVDSSNTSYWVAEIHTRSFEAYHAELELWRQLGRDIVHVERLADGWRIVYGLSSSLPEWNRTSPDR
jgi:myosin-crossreactive antigen